MLREFASPTNCDGTGSLSFVGVHPVTAIVPSGFFVTKGVPAGTPFVTKNPDGTIAVTGCTPTKLNEPVPSQFVGLANSRSIFAVKTCSSAYHGVHSSLINRLTRSPYFHAA